MCVFTDKPFVSLITLYCVMAYCHLRVVSVFVSFIITFAITCVPSCLQFFFIFVLNVEQVKGSSHLVYITESCRDTSRWWASDIMVHMYTIQTSCVTALTLLWEINLPDWTLPRHSSGVQYPQNYRFCLYRIIEIIPILVILLKVSIPVIPVLPQNIGIIGNGTYL